VIARWWQARERQHAEWLDLIYAGDYEVAELEALHRAPEHENS
jgi:hypothetical protein